MPSDKGVQNLIEKRVKKSKRRLPLNDRIRIAAQLAVRCRIFFDLWWLQSSKGARRRFHSAFDKHWDFFRFDAHAHFVACILYTSAVMDDDPNTVGVCGLLAELSSNHRLNQSADIDVKLKAVRAIAPKVAILRNNLFAHRSGTIDYEGAFKKARLTPNELRRLVKLILAIANHLLAARQMSPEAHYSLPAERATDMLRVLSRRLSK